MESKHDILRQWVAEKGKNGIKQHDERWLAAKIYTIGGSSLASVQGKNPYKPCQALISERIGLTSFNGDIKMQWGNLFEETIKKYVEYDKKCEILGEDLYIEGPDYTAYSPDGLTVLPINDVPTIVLCEFKCPYSRLPTAKPPSYYVPQVKMGMDLLSIPQIGMLAEGVFRRCTWDQIDNSPQCDTSLVPTTLSKGPISLGIIGFYYDPRQVDQQLKQLYSILCESCDGFYVGEDRERLGPCADLGMIEPGLFVQLMNLVDKKIIETHYCPILTQQQIAKGRDHIMDIVNKHLDSFIDFCTRMAYINIGILPWKLLQIKYHYIDKEDDYIKPWLPKIKEIIELVKQCNAPENASKKINLYSSYVNKVSGAGFSDEW